MNLTAIVTERRAIEECMDVLTKPLYTPSRLLIAGFDGTAEPHGDYLAMAACIGPSGEF